MRKKRTSPIPIVCLGFGYQIFNSPLVKLTRGRVKFRLFNLHSFMSLDPFLISLSFDFVKALKSGYAVIDSDER